MDDLFPGTRDPEALGTDGMLHAHPVFFAIYPAEADLSRVAGWQARILGEHAPRMTSRRKEVLHVSVAECGKPKRRRQTLQQALDEAERHFSFPAFDIAFDAIARFGRDGRACVACADKTGQDAIQRLRIALADAQRHAGLFVSRASQDAHLTLGYGDALPQQRLTIPPFGFHVAAVDLVVSEVGHSRHRLLKRWVLDATS